MTDCPLYPRLTPSRKKETARVVKAISLVTFSGSYCTYEMRQERKKRPDYSATKWTLHAKTWDAVITRVCTHPGQRSACSEPRYAAGKIAQGHWLRRTAGHRAADRSCGAEAESAGGPWGNLIIGSRFSTPCSNKNRREKFDTADLVRGNLLNILWQPGAQISSSPEHTDSRKPVILRLTGWVKLLFLFSLNWTEFCW